MISKQSKRKTRSKLRKPKFLSLRLDLTPPTPMPTTTDNDHDSKQLINLFPLHPENLMEQDKLDMSCIFSSCDDDGVATTLTGILCSDDEDEDVNTNNLSPSSVNYAEEEVELVRTAMRRHKMDKNDHEKFVCYSEVVERNKMIRGMSSSSSSTTSCYHRYNHNDHGHHRSKLVLKLDYEKIMNSWVNKGPLYIGNNSDLDAPQPQTVPDIQDDEFFFPSSINGTTQDERDNGGNGGVWIVPQMTHIENNGKGGEDDALQGGEPSETIHNREASVQRYKEKRRNRLFSKTIRYEVRKLNAEKRPRIKGRFVKRS